MTKKSGWIAVLVLGAGATGWLLRDFQGNDEKGSSPLVLQERSGPAQKLNGSSFHASEEGNTKARESPRHTTDDVQKSQSILREKNRTAAKENLEQLQGQVASLLKYDNDELMRFATGLDLPGNELLRKKYPEWIKAKGELEQLQKDGLGTTHPTIMAKVAEIDELKATLNESVSNIRLTLEAQVSMATDQVNRMSEDDR